jgi:monovalent cation:H+ antiporter-2, CPA2 family
LVFPRDIMPLVANIDLILTLAGGFGAALIFGYITYRAGLSPIVGYLLAGIAVGPFTPGFVADAGLAEQLAEIGVILLMFGVGLQFHVREFLGVWRVAVPGALVQSLAATVLAAVVMHALGWSWSAGIVFGLAISVASTVVLIRVLSDNNELHTPIGHIAVGWLVMEDLFTVFVLVLLPEVFGSGEPTAAGLLAATGVAAVKIAVLGIFAFAVGGWALPRVLHRIADTGSRELFILAVLAIALGIAVGSSLLFSVSMALGAFLAGMVVGRSDFGLRAATEALPLRDAFAVLFFVSVGMLFDWHALLASPLLVVAALAVILLGKPLAALALVVLMRYPLRVALSVALVLAQVGEFTFILGTMGRDLGILPPEAMNILVAAAIVSISLNPVLYRGKVRIERWLERGAPRLTRRIHTRTAAAAGTEPLPPPEASGRLPAIVVGYGPVGQTVVQLLRENNIDVTVVELNVGTVKALRAQGIRAIYGDATRIQTLTEAGARDASVLVLTTPKIHGCHEVLRQVRALNPAIRVIARTEYLQECAALCDAGADRVLSDEVEVALAVTEHILRQFGATPEQVERERMRVHDTLFCKTVPEESPRDTETPDDGADAPGRRAGVD